MSTLRKLSKVGDLIPLPYHITPENRFEILNQIITPLYGKSYDKQLGIKYTKNKKILQSFGKRLREINSPVICAGDGLVCPLERVKESPIVERYRNKDEFSIWPGIDGYNRTLGFFVGQPSVNKQVYCVEPYHIVVSRESHLSIAEKFQSYLKYITKYDSCENYGLGGHWRRFHIRSNCLGDHMVTAILHPQQLSQEQLNDEMNQLRQFFEDDCRIKSFYFQASRHTRLSDEKSPFINIFGDKTITESLFDKKFEISVDSFFQINTTAAEVLYKTIMSELNVNKKTTVLDICCGTGTLAILMASDVCRVVGIDSSQSAINDAKKNAAFNGIKNAVFISGTVERELPKLVDELYSDNIVVVANPTRAGLHPSVINILRELNFIRKIVYVSCKPEGYALRNFVHLCVPSNRHNSHLGSPFVPINAVPVDLFPQTNHCELIITFERF
ncbi:tRNA (uracil-5-)-methyltransferase homolog B-like [Oppia nitens]|uniref:tRNA (uracil-5-)-methyltransferase homolog B-like n=1 Tax=Oppia nitens TaxID=1686743 RepID=UPI0023DA9A59|nr:tRNA (uracil-5-)-methyltransferase homolog B-like [Oppia nitens]